jgi:hypothetical protein
LNNPKISAASTGDRSGLALTDGSLADSKTKSSQLWVRLKKNLQKIKTLRSCRKTSVITAPLSFRRGISLVAEFCLAHRFFLWLRARNFPRSAAPVPMKVAAIFSKGMLALEVFYFIDSH